MCVGARWQTEISRTGWFIVYDLLHLHIEPINSLWISTLLHHVQVSIQVGHIFYRYIRNILHSSLSLNRLSYRFINKAPTSIQRSLTTPVCTRKLCWGNTTSMPNKKAKGNDVTPHGVPLNDSYNDVERWCAVSRKSSIMSSNRSLPRCLHKGYHCYKNAKNLNIESKACLRKTCSITILL